MAPAFLAQFAAGCLLIVALAMPRLCGWKYLRLIALVSLGLAGLAGAMTLRGARDWESASYVAAVIGLCIGLVAIGGWLFANASQRDDVRASQRVWPAIGGVACALSASLLAHRPDALLSQSAPALGSMPAFAWIAASTVLGAMLLGSVTCGMLLGHRYLTETEMPIAPLRRLTTWFLAALAARLLWVTAAGWPVWTSAFQSRGDVSWFWMTLTVRVGVGLVGTGVFAYMAWDCVRRRATQSATALFYLAMGFVFLGELAGQYLTRAEGLAM